MLDPNRDFARKYRMPDPTENFAREYRMPDPNRGFARGVLAVLGAIGLITVVLVSALYWYVVVYSGVVIP